MRKNYVEIYSVISGSKAYGTANENSDTDIRSIAFPDSVSMFGLNPFESKVSKDPDETIYSFKKFVSLALQGNPNILELLWIEDPKNILIETEYSRHLQSIRREFLTRRVYKSYLGYAKAQLHKIKVDGNCSPEMNSKRKISIDINGYDVKAAMHLYRLLVQLEHIEMNYRIPMPLTGNNLGVCLEIRNGHVPFEAFKRLIEIRLERLAALESKSNLPEKPAEEFIDSIVVEMNRKFYGANS